MLKRHIDKHGYKKSNLSDSFLYITSGQKLEEKLPKIVKIENGIKRYFVVDIANELAINKFITFSKDNTKFWLTELGYDEARKNCLHRTLEFLNKNGGISIIVSTISLIVAICAFFKK
ncbi:Uncharacterized protein ChrSV_1862 [Chromobacterium vaccinii]|nr:Uncharacterized protein ChrSW_1862 [Chromobacterium vaccinii]QND89320.1 Uncharacterized protein ChrSV_1862 [Chromobacterium vaccinii]